jgi:hypothetical protein
MKGTEYFESCVVITESSVVITEKYNVMVNRGELIGTTEYRRGVALTDVVITGFVCICIYFVFYDYEQNYASLGNTAFQLINCLPYDNLY